jgi:tetratricopeptide (TPR) repeat protein
MRLRGISAIVLGAVGIVVLAAPQAQAAITVIGNGLARNCYEEAEFGGDTATAIETCTSALEMSALAVNERAATYINRGILKSRYDDPNGALADYNQGLQLDPNLGEGYVDRGAVQILFQHYDEALKDINTGIGMGPKKPEIAYYDRAIVDEALGNVRGAYEDYKKAVEIAPDFELAAQELTRFKVVVQKHTDGM